MQSPSSHLDDKDLLILCLEKKKKIKMTYKLSFFSLCIFPLVLIGSRQSHCCPLWSFKYPHITTELSTMCPYRPQYHYRLTGRKRLLLGENKSLFAMPFLHQCHLYGQLEMLVSTLKKSVDSIGHIRYYDAKPLFRTILGLSIIPHSC